MAVEAPRFPSVAEARRTQPVSQSPALTASSPLRERAWNLVPVSLSLFLASCIFWGPWTLPQVLAAGLMVFFTYWIIRSYAVVVACTVGLFRIKRWEATSWVAKYCELLASHPDARPWQWPRHMVIIPNYKEAEESLARTIDSLAAQGAASQLVVVLAMEAREPGAEEKAASLLVRYRGSFAEMFATYHPHGLPNETPGKGSNEAWAAREAHRKLIDSRRYDIARFTVTSCDADAVFHPRHFDALNYLFLTNADPYRAFWQPTIFNSNNIWDIPAPLRIPDGLSGINRLSNLVMPGSVKFPTSCYSTTWKLLAEVDYWDEEVIPEDWHVYLKSCFMLGDRVHVEPIFLPLGNDCVLTDGYVKTLQAHYAQSVRHAWGASDIPYAWRAALRTNTRLSWKRRLALSGAVTKVHSFWMSQWYIVTLGNLFPILVAEWLGAPMPHWYHERRTSLPGPAWQLDEMLKGDFSQPLGAMINVNIAGALIYFCLFPLIGMIIIETVTRPARPAYVSKLQLAGQYAMWPLMGVITFFFASLPALHAQLKLASGKHLVYRVAEKGSKHGLPHLPTVQPADQAVDALGAAGGGGAG